MESFLRKILFQILLYGVIFYLLSEAIYVAVHLPQESNTKQNWRSYEPDSILGWKHAGGYHFDDSVVDLKGRKYALHYSSHKTGFRRYHDTRQDSSMQLMIVGDSFTQGIEVSDDKMYYRHLEELLGCQAYAYGMASYSTLQQYLIIDQYIETIKPDMVLLQFCTNDFIENNFDLISQSRAPRGGMRPFLRQNGKIEYHYPESKWKLLIDQTYVLKDLLRRMGFDLNQVPEEQASSQWKIAHETERYRPYHTALSTTEQILKMIQDRVGEETPFLIFCADNYEPQQSDLLKICKKLEIPMLSFPTAKMIPNYSKLETYSKDTWHWNEIGHRIMGEELAQSIQHIISN